MTTFSEQVQPIVVTATVTTIVQPEDAQTPEDLNALYGELIEGLNSVVNTVAKTVREGASFDYTKDINNNFVVKGVAVVEPAA